MNLATTILFLSVTLAGQTAAPSPIIANWIGHLTSGELGSMEIAAEIKSDAGKLTGAIKTAHGDWRITSVTEKDGVFTIAFETSEGAGAMTGRLDNSKFSGRFQNPMASGTFELARSKKPAGNDDN
jgi:hypothetical protein